jgi:hypothetical protein
MSKYTWHRRASLALAAAVVLGACRGEPKKGPDSLGADTSLNRDLSLAGRDTTAQPQLNDVPANQPAAPAVTNPAPTTSRPATRTATTTRTPTKTAPKAPAPAPRTTPSGNTVTTTPSGGAAGGGSVGTIAAGTTLNLASNSRICTNTNAVGDKVTASLSEAVQGSNGAVIPAGATVTLTVTRLKRSENANDNIVMEFAVNSVTYGGHTYTLDASVETASVDRIRDQPKNKDVQKVVGGAVAGAIAGRILGKDTKSTVIGAAAGAAAGAGAAAATANYQGCIPSGGRIVVKLNSAAQVRV